MSAGLTLCLIVKDEEAFLDQCISAAADVCDDLVIVDTGSTDATKKIARSHTSRVYEFPMVDDFSAPRNAALDLIGTEWVLFLDADERFPEPDLAAIPGLLQAASPDVHAFTVLRYNLFATGGFYSGRVVKLMRNRPHIRFRRRVAESVKQVVKDAGGTVGDAPLLLNHFGHTRSLELRITKAHWYLSLMRAHLGERPDDARMLCNVAMLQRTLGQLDAALETSERAVAMNQSSASIWHHHGHMLRAAGQAEPALEAYLAGLRIDPANAGLLNMVGVMRLTLGRLDEAEQTLQQAAALDPHMPHLQINLGLVHQARGDYAEAASWFGAAADRNPGFLAESFPTRAETDLYSCLYNETIVQYAGLGYHLGYCRLMAEPPRPR